MSDACEAKQGKLYQQMSVMIGLLEEEQESVLISHRCNIIEVLNEAKKDLFNTENELTEEWYAERDAEFREKIMTKIIKWFGEQP